MRRCVLLLSVVAFSFVICVRPATADAFTLGGDATIVASPGGNPSGSPLVAQLISNSSGPDAYGYISFTPSSPLAPSALTNVSAEFDMTNGQFGLGAPRFSIDLSNGKNIFVYWGTSPNFNDAPTGWKNTGNLLTASGLRVDSTQLGGPFYGTWADAMGHIPGGVNIVGVSVVLDGGGGSNNQTLLIDSFTVNNSTFTVPEPASLLTWSALVGCAGTFVWLRRRRNIHSFLPVH